MIGMRICSMPIGSVIVRKPMNDFNPGQLIRLCRPEASWSGEYYDVSVFIQSESKTERKLYPINTIGMIVEPGFKGNPGVYQVLIGEVLAIVADSFIKHFDPDEVIFNDYDNERDNA